MRYAASEKLEIIRLVEGSHLSACQTSAKLGIPAPRSGVGMIDTRSVARRGCKTNPPSEGWDDLHWVAGQLRPMTGVSEHTWNLAQDRLGPQVATAALVLTFEKHCAGEVSSPGGGLRGMVEKAGAGELHLEGSFYGRLSSVPRDDLMFEMTCWVHQRSI